MSDAESLDFDQDQSLHIKPIANTALKQPKNRLFSSLNNNQLPTTNKCLNVMAINKVNNKLQVTEEFQDYLAEDDSNPDVVIVSLLGPKKIGKSFLLDTLLTIQNGKVCRIMAKNSKPVINSPAVNIKTRTNDRIVYFDNDGEPSSEIFLWNYFLSSLIIYSLSPNDKNEENILLDHLSFVQSHLDSEVDDLSLPQLILVRRDTNSRQIKDRDLVRRIEQYSLFHPEILIVHLPYPGGKDIKSKELLDVPLKELDPKFINQAEKIHQISKSQKSKIIRGNYLSTKILSLTLQPVTKGLNKQHRISTTKVWDEVIQILSIGFYNFYLKSYSQELEKEFQSEKPCDKYTLYKRLSKLKRKVNKKVEGFKNIEEDPIFMKYKTKLEQTIKSKQNLVKEINQSKSRQANEQYCKKLMSELNDRNCAELIDQYCKTELDDQKTEVLLQNFEVIFREKSKSYKLASNPSKKPSLQIITLEKEMSEIDQQILEEKNKKFSAQTYNFDEVKRTLSLKQEKLNSLQQQYEELNNASKLASKNKPDNKQIEQLEDECDRLKRHIEECDKEIDDIRRNRETKIKESDAELEQELKREENELKRLQKLLRQGQMMPIKTSKAETGKKQSTCCAVM